MRTNFRLLAPLATAAALASACAAGPSTATSQGVADVPTQTADVATDTEDAQDAGLAAVADSAADVADAEDAWAAQDAADSQDASAPQDIGDAQDAAPYVYFGNQPKVAKGLPSFTQVVESTGNPVTSAALLGHWTVLWFYPAAQTTG
jgi:hypothetical protein